MNYRPDIDGLRAIAILFVLFFHAGLALFPSGFIGVDVFFVISGYLITGIIHDSLERQNFSLTAFYSRRLWRLQPVFVCLLFVTLLLTLIFYLPEDFLNFSKSARKTSIFISNSYFERVTNGYFSTNNNQLPLLHTWSLSIEWQCYLILPLALAMLYRLLSPRLCRSIIAGLTLVFFGITLYYSMHAPEKTYYQLTSRLFEFLIGSCVVLNPIRYSMNKFTLNAISLGALCVLIYIATRQNIHPGFPNVYALILCASTALLLSLGQQDEKPIVTRLLSQKPCVVIGLLSYSLYIWHWPVFALIRYFAVPETKTVLTLAFLLIIILALLSRNLIEQPARKMSNASLKYTLTYLVVMPVIVLHLNDFLAKKYEGFPARFDEVRQIDATLKQYTIKQRALCLNEKNMPIDPHCTLGIAHLAKKRGFMLGDSHANHFWGFLDALAKDAQVSVLTHSTAACLTLPGVFVYDWNKKLYTACHEQSARYYNIIKKNHYDFVILGQNWNGYQDASKLIPESPNQMKETIEHGLERALDQIIASGAKPILIKAITQSTPINAYDCFWGHIKHRTHYAREQCQYKQSQEGWQNALFETIKKKYPDVIIIDPSLAQCPEGLCIADIHGIPIFRDAGHITDYASLKLGRRYLKHYKNPLIF